MSEMEIEQIARLAWDAVQGGNWWAAGAAGGALGVAMARKLLAKRIPWLSTDEGGAALVLVTGTLFGCSVGLMAGKAIGVALVLTAAKTAFVTAGGYTVVKKLVWGRLMKLLGLGGEATKARPSSLAAPVLEPSVARPGTMVIADADVPRGGKGDPK